VAASEVLVGPVYQTTEKRTHIYWNSASPPPPPPILCEAFCSVSTLKKGTKRKHKKKWAKRHQCI